tara:strand:- start:4057 stop:4719 length:663 start_codon:yes stop_codon:yes gene_type:complete
MSKVIIKYDGGEISNFLYFDNFFNNEYYESIFKWLKTLNYISGIKKNNEKIDREQIWFDNNNNYFCKLWTQKQDRWQPHKYPNKLLEIENRIKDKLHCLKQNNNNYNNNNNNNSNNIKNNYNFNTCLINKYNTGEDIISAHKDNKFSFGEYPNIIIYSVGCQRELKVNSDISKESFIIPLLPNSLLIMSGASQKYFTHEIIKNNSKDIRYSLTFRKYIDN